MGIFHVSIQGYVVGLGEYMTWCSYEDASMDAYAVPAVEGISIVGHCCIIEYVSDSRKTE